MKLPALLFCATLLGATAAQAEILDRRKQCAKWEYIPASEYLGNPDTALLFCSDETQTWMSLRIECLADAPRMAVYYHPGFEYAQPPEPEPVTEEGAEEVAEVVEVTAAEADAVTTDTATTTENTSEPTPIPMLEKEMVFFDFRSLGYTSVAYFDHARQDWSFYEAEPLSQVFAKLISGSYADISLLATGVTERLPLRGSGKALRPVVETCRLAKIKAAEEANN